MQKTVSYLKSAGVQACGSIVDARQPNALEQWVEASADQLGGVDIIVPNVGALADSQGADEDSWRAGFKIEILATVRMVETAFDTRAVDKPEDLARVEALMRDDPLTETY